MASRFPSHVEMKFTRITSWDLKPDKRGFLDLNDGYLGQIFPELSHSSVRVM